MNARIHPRGLNQRDEVNLMFGVMASIKQGCELLDLDGSITETTYVADDYTAAYDNLQVENDGGDILGERGASGAYGYFISPRGIGQAARLEWLYDTLYALNALTNQIDGDGNPPDTITYNTDYYVGRITKSVENQRGAIIGPAAKTYLFNPRGVFNMDTLVDMYWDIVYCLQGIWALCTSDTAPATGTYTALAYTVAITPTIENSQGIKLGN